MDPLCSTFADVQGPKGFQCPFDWIGIRHCDAPAIRDTLRSLHVLRACSRAGELRIAWSRTIRAEAVLQTTKEDLRSTTVARLARDLPRRLDLALQRWRERGPHGRLLLPTQ